MRKQNIITCKSMIESLNVSKDIKEMLYKVLSVASSNNPKMKASVKDLFIKSPSCKELSKIAKCYERIITTNMVYPIRGSRTYLELAFPFLGKDSEYKEFFASPKLVAATQNVFTGVFLISFEQWKGASELIRDIVFQDLVNFINNNKNNISFVFHVTPDFSDANVLYNELEKYINLCLLEHSFPDINLAILFIEKKLEESGIKFSAEGKKEIKKLLEDKISIISNSYHGYETLEKLAANIKFELCASVAQKQIKDKNDNYFYSVGKKEVTMLTSIIDVPDEKTLYQGKLGFH